MTATGDKGIDEEEKRQTDSQTEKVGEEEVGSTEGRKG